MGSCQDPPQTAEDAALLKQLIEQMKKNGNNAAPIPDNRRSVGIFQNKTELPPPPPVYEIRVYDLADLFAIAPSNYAHGWEGQDTTALLGSGSFGPSSNQMASAPIGGGMGGMGGGGMGGGGMGGMFSVDGNVNGAAYRPTPNKLIEVIQETIPGEWKSGKEKITWIGSSLIVSALPETHTSLQRLLDLLQKRWNARVTFQVRLDWIWISQEESMQLEKIKPMDGTKGSFAIDREELDKWIGTLPKNEDRPHTISARLQCYNGQSISWVSGSQKRTVASWARGEKGKLIAEPVAMQTGVACEICPMLAHASSNVTLDVRSRYIWRDDEAEKGAIENRGATETLPRPDEDQITGQSISSTVRIPVGAATVIGGGSNAESNEWQIYLLASTSFASAPESRAETPVQEAK